MSMDTELIGKFITQQVSAAMSEKTKQYEKKIKELEKGGKDGVSGEMAKTERGVMDVLPRNRKNPRLRRLQSQKHTNNMCLDWHKAERESFRTLLGEKNNNQTIPTAVHQKRDEGGKQRARKAHQGQQIRPRKPTTPNHAVVQRKFEGKLWLPSG